MHYKSRQQHQLNARAALMLATLSATLLTACGGGSGSSSSADAEAEAARLRKTTSTTTTSTTPTSTTTTSTTTTSTTTTTGTTTTTSSSPTQVDACVAGTGKDYQVVGSSASASQYASLALVPWDKLVAGDTVRIFYNNGTPYRGHILVAASGTATAPVRVCGVKGTNGERPIIDGENAVARSGLSYVGASQSNLQEKRAIVMIDRLGSQDWGTAYPSYVQIDGLEIRAATPAYSFTNSKGTVQTYDEFSACVWIERGKHITIADNVIHDCSNGVYSRSVEDGAGTATITEDIRIAGNYIYGNGVVDSDRLHNLYMESVNIVYEFNRVEPLRAGAGGSAIKDRSAGTVVRYNYISGGSRSLDLVEAEDMPTTAMATPAYHSTYVYGNIITKDSTTGSAVHYGGDHYWSSPSTPTWGEPIFRKGTLYFYNNTVILTTGVNAPVFQLSTTEETAQVWNNVLLYNSADDYPSLRACWDDVNPYEYVSGGTFNLGKNWVPTKFVDVSPGRSYPNTPSGMANLIKGTTSPVDATTLIPLSGSTVVDAAQANLAAVAAYPVEYQMDVTTFKGKARTVVGAGADIGAVER